MPIEIIQPEKIQNLDVLDMCARIDRWLLEIQNCVSATRHHTSDADYERCLGMASDLRSKYEVYIQSPELDLPRYHPHARPLEEPPVLEVKQNPDTMRLTHLLIAGREEIVHANDAERVNSFSDPGKARIEAWLTKIDQTLEDLGKNRGVDAPNSPDEKPQGTAG